MENQNMDQIVTKAVLMYRVGSMINQPAIMDAAKQVMLQVPMWAYFVGEQLQDYELQEQARTAMLRVPFQAYVTAKIAKDSDLEKRAEEALGHDDTIAYRSLFWRDAGTGTGPTVDFKNNIDRLRTIIRGVLTAQGGQ